MDAVEQRLRALAAYCASYPQVGLEDSVVSEHLAACLREVRAVTNLSQQKCQDVQAFLQSATLPGPVKSGLKEALMEQLARSEAGRLDSARKCLQNFVTVPWYLVPSLWAALLSEGNTVATKHSLLLQFLARLGLKNPSEATHGMVTVLTHLTSQVVLRDAQQAFAIYVRQKEVSQAFFRRLLPEVERPYYRELPADPMQLERRLFDQVYSEEQPARPLPLAYSELLALHAAVPLRKSNAQLPRSSSVQGTGNLWQALLGSAQISNPEAALVLQRALSALSASSSVQLPGFRLLGSAASGAVAEGQGNSSAPELPGFQLALPQSTSCLSLPAAGLLLLLLLKACSTSPSSSNCSSSSQRSRGNCSSRLLRRCRRSTSNCSSGLLLRCRCQQHLPRLQKPLRPKLLTAPLRMVSWTLQPVWIACRARARRLSLPQPEAPATGGSPGSSLLALRSFLPRRTQSLTRPRSRSLRSPR